MQAGGWHDDRDRIRPDLQPSSVSEACLDTKRSGRLAHEIWAMGAPPVARTCFSDHVRHRLLTDDATMMAVPPHKATRLSRLAF